MPTFRIPIEWRCYGEVTILAKSLDEAVDEVNLNPDEIVLPENWELEEGSIEVNFETVEELNPGHKMSEEPQRKELEAKDFGIIDKELLKKEQEKLFEEMEARRHLNAMGEGYGEDTEEEMDEDEG